jgi:glycosyltransferase involved in cell wall biosynthesis
MFNYERQVCQAARHVIAVSDLDAETMRNRFGPVRVSSIPTGVDVEYYTPPDAPEPIADLVFTGSMDWLPNIDGIRYFSEEVLPIIQQRRPETTLAIVGRNAGSEIQQLSQKNPRIRVTGTVPDVRPYLWGAAIAIVPLRIGGGTRLKIYEAMAARVPVVSTTIGAEGLSVQPGENIRIADSPDSFAAQCLELMEQPAAAQRQSAAAWNLVNDHFSWAQVTKHFEAALDKALSSLPC